MNLIGKKVKHSIFGEGVIISQTETRISVNFSTSATDKTFIFPLCFQSHLQLLDNTAVSEIKVKIEEAERLEREKAYQEAAKAHEEYMQKENHSSHHNGVIVPQMFPSVSSFCDQYQKALAAEIAYLQTTGGERQRIFDGRLIEGKIGHYIYSFEADSELNYPDGAQITLWTGTTSISANIIGCEDFTVIIALSISLGNEVTSIEFSAEPWRLIFSLSERLNTIKGAFKSPIVQALVCDGFKNIQYGKSIVKGQDNACEAALENPITFIWGPPGTGKTETLAKIALKHIALHHRVLMLSYSNVSVDGAILRVYKLDSNKRAGKLVRYGYPRDKDLMQHDFLTSYNLAIHNHPDLLKERMQLIAERKKLSRTSLRYVEIDRRLTQIRGKLDAEEKAAVHNASFVATTVAKAVTDKELYDDHFDAVIFDEASMAYIPQIIFSASLAVNNFICIGDFAQLPPIVQNSSESIMNADIFQYCGITKAVEEGNGHKWLCLLDIQYRMHPAIASFASMNMYHSLLRSADKMEGKRYDIVSSAPLPKQAIGLADISGMMSVCTQTADSSRVNPLSAFIAFDIEKPSEGSSDGKENFSGSVGRNGRRIP